MNYLSKLTMIVGVSCAFIFSSCNDDDAPLPTLGVAFETTALGVTTDVPSVDAVISLSRPVSVASELTITVTETLVQHGVHYTTNPAPENGVITISIPVGSDTASFNITRADGIPENSSIAFELSNLSGETDFQISGNTSLSVSFEAIVSPGFSLTAEMGGPTEPNQVYLDFSANLQTAAARDTWDLGFYAGNEDKVILNYSAYMMARALDKTDMNEVSAADTVDFAKAVVIATAGAHFFIDNPNRSLENLAIADVSGDASENNVYIINRGFESDSNATPDPGSVAVNSTPLGWKKIRILKDGDDYIVQHADIAATSFTETRISKDPTYNFNYFSFDSSDPVVVEPEKDKWDIVFTPSSNIAVFGPDGPGAYGFSDFVLSNRQGGVQVIKVTLDTDDTGQILPGQTTYDDFVLADINEDLFVSDGNAIGSGWRTVFSGTSAFANIFYVVKDPAGNNYKVQFLSLLSDEGIRGNPSLKYELLQ
ncbi:MAG: HmuY family protein [Bacteroidota bacterium]